MPFFWSKSDDSSELTQSTENGKSAEVIEATTTEESEKTEQSGEEKGELENEIYSIFQSVRLFDLCDFSICTIFQSIRFSSQIIENKSDSWV